MALPEESKHNTHKPSITNNGQKSEKKEKPLTKVIVRRLPPQTDKETFITQVSPLPEYDYIYLVKGDSGLGDNSFARAYINFLKPEDIYDFKEKFDNYVFLDSKGHEYPAVVEFASFQKIPKKRNKSRVDPKCDTIESDTLYMEFLENLNKPLEVDEKPEFSYQILTESRDASKDMKTTPLLEFVKNRRVERMKIREERREERKRRELERKKIKDDERRRRYDEKPLSIHKSSYISLGDVASDDIDIKEKESTDKFESSLEFRNEKCFYKNKDRKFEDRRKEIKPKFPVKKEYPERREYRGKRDYYKDQKYEDYKNKKYDDEYKSKKYDEPNDKKETEKQFPTKKIKKYSEKREERKMEAQRAEQQKAEINDKETKSEITDKTAIPLESEKKEKDRHIKNNENKYLPKDSTENKKTENISTLNLEQSASTSKNFQDNKNKERIRNKDRPAIVIYRPGMLSKRKLVDNEDTK